MEKENPIKHFFEKYGSHWPVVIGLFIILEIVNRVFLRSILPSWGYASISIMLVLLASGYVTLMYQHFSQNVKSAVEEKEKALLSRVNQLEKSMLRIQEEQQSYGKILTDEIKDTIKEEAQSNNTYLVKQIKDAKDELHNGVDDMLPNR